MIGGKGRGMSKKNDALKGCLCAVGCETLYGISYLFTRSAHGAGVLALLCRRFLIAFVLMDLLRAPGILSGVYLANARM